MSRKKKTRRKVAPYKLWFFDDTFYLIGNCGMRHGVRIFSLDRIKNIQLTEETFEVSKDFNIDDFIKFSFGVFQGEPVRVRIWFAADIAEYIREKTWHENQKIETQKDDSILPRSDCPQFRPLTGLKPECVNAYLRSDLM